MKTEKQTTDAILPDIYKGELNTLRIKAYRKVSEEYNLTEGSVGDIFCRGANWYKEIAQTKAAKDKAIIDELKEALKTISGWAGNLSDEAYTSKTGANDAAYRGQMLVSMRAIANAALNRLELKKEST